MSLTLSNLEPSIGVVMWPFMFKGWEQTEAAMTGKPRTISGIF